MSDGQERREPFTRANKEHIQRPAKIQNIFSLGCFPVDIVNGKWRWPFEQAEPIPEDILSELRAEHAEDYSIPTAENHLVPTKTNSGGILIEAHELINGQRAADYGTASENFNRIARRWSDHLGIEVTAEQVILCMIELKMSRLAHTPGHRDSWLDVAGYVGCKGKLEAGL